MEPESLLEAQLREPLHGEAEVDAPMAKRAGLDDQMIPVRPASNGPRLVQRDLLPELEPARPPVGA
jgi:hypothetical protein